MLYRHREYLPHIDNAESTYFITFRLAGTLPRSVLEQLKSEIDAILNNAKRMNRRLTPQEEMRLKYLKSDRIQEYLDKGIGECWLNLVEIAQMVKQSIAFFDGKKYISHVFCIMPNHLHWLLTPRFENLADGSSTLISIMHSIKSFTAHRANKILNRAGHFWSKEYYDHRVTSDEQFEKLVFYILENPVKAGLCKTWQQWPWTFCNEKIRDLLAVQE